MNLTYNAFHTWVSTILIVASSGAKILALTGKLASAYQLQHHSHHPRGHPMFKWRNELGVESAGWASSQNRTHQSTFLILWAGLALIRRDDVPKPGEFISRCRGLHQPRTATQIFRFSCRSSYLIRKMSWLAFLLLMQHWYYRYISPCQ